VTGDTEIGRSHQMTNFIHMIGRYQFVKKLKMNL